MSENNVVNDASSKMIQSYLSCSGKESISNIQHTETNFDQQFTKKSSTESEQTLSLKVLLKHYVIANL